MLIKQSTAPSLTIVCDSFQSQLTVAPTSYSVCKAGGALTAGTGSSSASQPGVGPWLLAVNLSGGDTTALGDLLIVALDSFGNVVGKINADVVAFDPTDAASLGLSEVNANTQYIAGIQVSADPGGRLKVCMATAEDNTTGNVYGMNVTSAGDLIVSPISNRKNGASSTLEVLMQDSTTGAPKTGLTVAATISKDGGTPASTTNSVTEIGLGQYQLVLTSTEMTANNLFIQYKATGALTANQWIQTQP